MKLTLKLGILALLAAFTTKSIFCYMPTPTQYSYTLVNNLASTIKITMADNEIKLAPGTSTEIVTPKDAPANSLKIVSIGHLKCKDIENDAVTYQFPFNNMIDNYVITFSNFSEPEYANENTLEFQIETYGTFSSCIPPYSRKTSSVIQTYTLNYVNGYLEKSFESCAN